MLEAFRLLLGYGTMAGTIADACPGRSAMLAFGRRQAAAVAEEDL